MNNQELRTVLADTFLMYSHAHIFHWNILGPSFFERHAFLERLYTDLWGAVDSIAEQIRALDEPAPNSLSSIVAPANFQDMAGFSDWDNIRVTLCDENAQVIASLRSAFDAAEGNEGLRNFLADRLDRHAKWAWMLNAS